MMTIWAQRPKSLFDCSSFCSISLPSCKRIMLDYRIYQIIEVIYLLTKKQNVFKNFEILDYSRSFSNILDSSEMFNVGNLTLSKFYF